MSTKHLEQPKPIDEDLLQRVIWSAECAVVHVPGQALPGIQQACFGHAVVRPWTVKQERVCIQLRQLKLRAQVEHKLHDLGTVVVAPGAADAVDRISGHSVVLLLVHQICIGGHAQDEFDLGQDVHLLDRLDGDGGLFRWLTGLNAGVIVLDRLAVFAPSSAGIS